MLISEFGQPNAGKTPHAVGHDGWGIPTQVSSYLHGYIYLLVNRRRVVLKAIPRERLLIITISPCISPVLYTFGIC